MNKPNMPTLSTPLTPISQSPATLLPLQDTSIPQLLIVKDVRQVLTITQSHLDTAQIDRLMVQIKE